MKIHQNDDTSKCHDDHSRCSFTTEFQLYIPKAEAKSVWMEVNDGKASHHHVKLLQSTTHPRLWLAKCSVTSGDSYYYGAKVSAWLGFKTDKILENDSRVVTKNSVHRDIFISCEKKIVDRIDGCKFFFEAAINTIGTQEARSIVQILLSEFFFQLDHEYLQYREQHELGRFAVECASKVALSPFAAAFVIYYLSRIYDKADSMFYSNIQACNAEHLLKSLKGWSLQQCLGAWFSSKKVTEVMFWLVKVGVKSADWDSFALWCYPSLSSTEILSMFKPTRNYHPTTQLVSKLCSCIGQQEDVEHIFSFVISHVTSLSALCKVVKTCSQSDLQLLEKCRPYFVHRVMELLDKMYTMQHLKELSDMAELIFSVDCASVSEVLPHFEQKLLKILDRREDATQYVQQLEKIISYPAVFRDKQHAEILLQIFATSSVRSNHALLPKFLQLQKFLMLDDETMLQLIDQWLGKVASVTLATIGPHSVCGLHKYISQVLNLPDDVPEDVKKEIKKRCMKTFCHLALPRITKLPHISHLQVLQQIVHEMKGDGIQPVEELQSAIEATATVIIQKTSACELQHAQILVHLLLQEKLFVDADCSTKVLEFVALSRAQNVHCAFLEIMTAEKFWKIIPTRECERMFDLWLSQAISCHSINKAKKRSSGKVDYYILFLYEYLADVLALPSASSSETVRNQVEIKVKKELIRFEPKNVVDMLDSAASELKEDAVKLLEQHLQDAEIKNLMSDREYHSELDRFAESAGDDWKVKQRYRYCFTT